MDPRERLAMTSERNKDSASSKSPSECLRENEDETKLDLRSSDDLKGSKLDRYEAKKLAQQIIQDGNFSFTSHCEKELAADGMGTVDAVNIIAGGKIIREPEFSDKFQAWRYRIETQRMGVVIEIHSNVSLRVITGWRNKK
jgi:hypothetical protein